MKKLILLIAILALPVLANCQGWVIESGKENITLIQRTDTITMPKKGIEISYHGTTGIELKVTSGTLTKKYICYPAENGFTSVAALKRYADGMIYDTWRREYQYTSGNMTKTLYSVYSDYDTVQCGYDTMTYSGDTLKQFWFIKLH